MSKDNPFDFLEEEEDEVGRYGIKAEQLHKKSRSSLGTTIFEVIALIGLFAYIFLIFKGCTSFSNKSSHKYETPEEQLSGAEREIEELGYNVNELEDEVKKLNKRVRELEDIIERAQNELEWGDKKEALDILYEY